MFVKLLPWRFEKVTIIGFRRDSVAQVQVAPTLGRK